jgi:hypothetical protein
MIFVKCLHRQKQIACENPEDVKLWENGKKEPIGITVHSSQGEDYEIPFHAVGFIVDTHKASQPRENVLES